MSRIMNIFGGKSRSKNYEANFTDMREIAEVDNNHYDSENRSQVESNLNADTKPVKPNAKEPESDSKKSRALQPISMNIPSRTGEHIKEQKFKDYMKISKSLGNVKTPDVAPEQKLRRVKSALKSTEKDTLPPIDFLSPETRDFLGIRPTLSGNDVSTPDVRFHTPRGTPVVKDEPYVYKYRQNHTEHLQSLLKSRRKKRSAEKQRKAESGPAPEMYIYDDAEVDVIVPPGEAVNSRARKARASSAPRQRRGQGSDNQLTPAGDQNRESTLHYQRVSSQSPHQILSPPPQLLHSPVPGPGAVYHPSPLAPVYYPGPQPVPAYMQTPVYPAPVYSQPVYAHPQGPTVQSHATHYQHPPQYPHSAPTGYGNSYGTNYNQPYDHHSSALQQQYDYATGGNEGYVENGAVSSYQTQGGESQLYQQGYEEQSYGINSGYEAAYQSDNKYTSDVRNGGYDQKTSEYDQYNYATSETAQQDYQQDYQQDSGYDQKTSEYDQYKYSSGWVEHNENARTGDTNQVENTSGALGQMTASPGENSADPSSNEYPTSARSTGGHYSHRPAGRKAEEIESVFSKIRHNRVESVMESLSNGFDPCSVDELGNTMLHVCCQNNRKRLARVVINAGCPVNEITHKGLTPLDFCYQYHNTELGNWLANEHNAVPCNGAGRVVTDEFGNTLRSPEEVRMPARSRSLR